MSEEVYQKRGIGIYIDLDTLLDTRMGTMMMLDPEQGMVVINDDGYYSRVEEVFPGFDKKIFDEAYLKRDQNTLEHSAVSNMIFILKEAVADLKVKVYEHPLYNDVIVYVNIHPYQLSDAEKSDLHGVLRQHLLDMAKIEFIDVSLEDLDCAWVYTHVSHLFMYHFDVWLNARARALAHRGLPYISLYCPRIFFERKPTEEEIEQLKGWLEVNDFDHFDFIEKTYMPLLQIHFLPVDHFCVINDYADRIGTDNTSEKELS